MRQGDGEGQHDVGNQDAGEKKQPDARGHAQTGIESGSLAESPSAESRRQPAQRDRRQRNGNARGPVVRAENPVSTRRSPSRSAAPFPDNARRPGAP